MQNVEGEGEYKCDKRDVLRYKKITYKKILCILVETIEVSYMGHPVVRPFQGSSSETNKHQAVLTKLVYLIANQRCSKLKEELFTYGRCLQQR